jgi:TrmH family RNA methyltransferase
VGKTGKVREITMEKASKMQLKNIRRLLKEKKWRDFEGIFVAEGEKIVRDTFVKGHSLDSVFVSDTFAKDKENKKFISSLKKKRVPVCVAGDAEFDRVSSLQHSQGILAVVKKPKARKCSVPSGESAFIVLCDGIQDPGNLGTIIRTSAAFGADSVLLLDSCADIFNPKVVRSSSGAILDIPVSGCDLAGVDNLKDQGFQLLVSHLTKEKSKDISAIKKIPPRCIVAFGSEGRGVSKAILERADWLFFIPITEKTESLNVTSAAAIALYVFTHLRERS